MSVPPPKAAYAIAVSINNIINRNSPLPADLFSIPIRNTRHASNGNFNLPKCHNVYGERLIQFNGTKIWNAVPLEIKTARNFGLACKSFFSMESRHVSLCVCLFRFSLCSFF
uniref:Tick transposon n=1 Tax=Rhipicephalus appendiculatus TaxID=34631 RepID=A0A131YNQ6_RHIAP